MLKIELIVAKNLSSRDAEKALQQQIQVLLANKESNVAQFFPDAEMINKGKVSFLDIEFSDVNKQQSK